MSMPSLNKVTVLKLKSTYSVRSTNIFILRLKRSYGFETRISHVVYAAKFFNRQNSTIFLSLLPYC